MDKCPKVEETAKNLVCKNSSHSREKLEKKLEKPLEGGGASTFLWCVHFAAHKICTMLLTL